MMCVNTTPKQSYMLICKDAYINGQLACTECFKFENGATAEENAMSLLLATLSAAAAAAGKERDMLCIWRYAMV